MLKIIILISLSTMIGLFFISCGSNEKSSENLPATKKVTEKPSNSDPMKDKGIGPVKKVYLSSKIDEKRAARGKETYKKKCTACHKEYEKYIGPPPVGIFKRRTPEWVMNMMLNPEEMIQKDPIAKNLFKKFLSPMANQNLTQEEARDIIEYFRTLEEK